MSNKKENNKNDEFEMMDECCGGGACHGGTEDDLLFENEEGCCGGGCCSSDGDMMMEGGCCGGGCCSSDSENMMEGGCCGGSCSCGSDDLLDDGFLNEGAPKKTRGGCGSAFSTEDIEKVVIKDEWWQPVKPLNQGVEENYWQDVNQKVLPAEALRTEFADETFDTFSVKKSRRNFLKIMGFSVAALPMTGCVKIPVRKALPYLKKSDVAIAGVPYWYATTFKGLPVLLKTREGRPIKVEGNDLSTMSYGGTDAQAQASVLSLYDSSRFKMPRTRSGEVEWDKFDAELKDLLDDVNGNGKAIAVITPSLYSPSQVKLINEFTKNFRRGYHFAYDAVSEYGVTKASKETFGEFGTAEYSFKNADLIVSFESDFLGSMRKNEKHAREYANRRDLSNDPNNKLNRHIQLESLMTMTGSNADIRYTKSIKDQREVLASIYAQLKGESLEKEIAPENKALAKSLATELYAHKGTSLVISGDQNYHAQILVNKINDFLGNLGKTVSFFTSPGIKLANDEEFDTFLNSAIAGDIGAALFIGVNPAYDYFDHEKIKRALKSINHVVTFSTSEDETSKLSNFNAPDNHEYESWSDNIVAGDELSFTQPVIQPLFGSRMAMETLQVLMDEKANFHDYVRETWDNTHHSKQSKYESTQSSWDHALHNGVVTLENLVKPVHKSVGDIKAHVKELLSVEYQTADYKLNVGNGKGFHLSLYQNVAMKDGSMANNPWLQELPDPITKATWDNYLMLAPKVVRKMDMKDGDVVEVSNGHYHVEVPVLSQPGMDDKTAALAFGYGRSVAGKVAKNLGGNAFPFVALTSGNIRSQHTSGITIKKTGKVREIAQTQTHHSMEGRDIVRESTYSEFLKKATAGNKDKAHLVNIYPKHDDSGHQWAMAIDLNRCNGCSMCIISCSAENNVPVVGRQEVLNRREMHWLRVDRYYKGSEENPEVVHQMLTCHHCENAPCENVCPVMAIVHSSDGINQQVYNRCVGTRYCANNCPYKVRRFNWFNYDHSDPYAKMQLNPDVVVRSRGVMEKCSLCIQRIQEKKLAAKREGRPLRDGEIKTACQQSCPADAIVFGDKNDPNSKIAKYIKDPRNYTVLEELNVKPRVSYLTKIRNK